MYSFFLHLLIETEDFYIKNPAESTAYHAQNFYRYSGRLFQVIYNLVDEVNILLNWNFTPFVHDKLNRAPDEGRFIKQLFLSNIRLFEYNPIEKKPRWADRAVSLQNRLISRICKQFEEGSGESGTNVQGGRTGVVI